jgi:pimeloyl-ACP methyl ester carboxylesterase
MARRFDTGVVLGKGGVALGYRQVGQGPGVVLMHGSMSSGYNHVQLACALADRFTVYIPDRRGRGLSGPYGEPHSVRDDVDDLDALLAHTGAQSVFGLSSGAIICLQAALSLPAIRRAAIFEPPLFVDPAVPEAILARFDGEMAQGKLAAAMVTGMLGAQMGPPIFSRLPRWVLEWLTARLMASESKRPQGEYVSMGALAPTLHYDFQIVAETSGDLERFRAIPAEVLLLGGSKSPAYLKAALDVLERVLPRARRVELAGLDHAASWNADRGGQPEAVARELARFFA